MTEVETGRNTAWIDPVTSFQCVLNAAAPITASLTWLLLLQTERRCGPLQEQEVHLNLMLLNHIFYWNAKEEHVVHHLYTVFPVAEEEGILFAPQCSWSNPTGVDRMWGVHHELSALGWSSGSWTCSTAALIRACTHVQCAPRHSSASPPLQALGITAIGTDTLPTATSNLFKAMEADHWPRGLPWLTAFTPFFH